MKRAVLIGINYFGSDCELRGCHNDVDTMKNFLCQHGYTEFTVLRDTQGDTKFLLPDCPTKNNILSELNKAILKTVEGDYLFIHYSGHGSYLNDQNNDEKDGQDECICPVDYNSSVNLYTSTSDLNEDSGFIRDDTLNDILVKGLAKGAKLRVCFDSCHSGSCLDLPCRWVKSKTTESFYKENSTIINKDIIFISGCVDTSTSADAFINGKSSGAMTWALSTSLCVLFLSAQNNTLLSTWKDLIKMMRTNLKERRYTQVPQISTCTKEQIYTCIDI